MKKILAAVIAAAMLITSACSGDNAAEASTNTGANAATGDGAADAKTVYGEVSEVIGNLVKLKLIEMPEIMNFNGDGFQPGEFQISGNLEDIMNNLTEEQRTQLQERMEQGGGAFSFPAGGTDAGNMPSEQRGNPGEGVTFERAMPADGATITDSGRPAGGRAFETAYTGEELEIIIPVGIPVMTRSGGADGMTETEVKLESISAGSMMLITYAEDGETVVSALLMNTAGGMRFGGQGTQGQFFFSDGGNITPGTTQTQIYFSGGGN